MIDMHNHILMNVDDGPQNKADAIKLLQQAKDEQISTIIATPHYTSKFPNTFEKVKSKIKELCQLTEVKALNIKILPGQEVRISQHMIKDLKAGRIKGLNASNYILIEFPPNEVPDYTFELFRELQTLNYIPIIAHPERNSVMIKNMQILYDLVQQGALSQITSSSLGGYFGVGLQLASLEMMRCHLTHFIASDAHHYDWRPFILGSLFEEEALKPYHQQIDTLIRNAQAIIENRPITKLEPMVPKYSKAMRQYLG